MVYASAADVRLLTGLSSSAISDADLVSLILLATAQVNVDVQLKIEDERVDYIDTEKPNTIDGSNKTFYVRKPYIGDRTNDGVVGTGDVYCYTLDSTGTRTTYTLSALSDDYFGKITLTNAPSTSEELFACYMSSPVDMETPNPLVKLATIYLASAFAYVKANAGNVKSWHVGKVSVSKDSGFETYFKEYKNIVNKILDNWVHLGEDEYRL